MRIAYAGGLNCGKRAVKLALSHIRESYPGAEVRGFTFSETQRDYETFHTFVEGADVRIGHSVGAMALASTGEEMGRDTFLYGPPVPVSRSRLLGRALLKTVRMIVMPNNYGRPKDVYTYLASSAAEMISHPIANLGALLTGRISSFDCRSSFGPEVTTVYGQYDEFFGNENLPGGARVVEGQYHDSILFKDVFAEQPLTISESHLLRLA